VEADLDPAVGSLDAVRGLAVLRLTQEALTNVAKHAGPSALARLLVSVVDGVVHWEVSNNVGGWVPAGVPSGGHGSTGMRERVEVLGGQLDVGPTDAGWRVRTVLPAVASAAASAPTASPISPPVGPAAPAPREREAPDGPHVPELA
jgi:signal transduction histidine kinase